MMGSLKANSDELKTACVLLGLSEVTALGGIVPLVKNVEEIPLLNPSLYHLHLITDCGGFFYFSHEVISIDHKVRASTEVAGSGMC